MEYTEGSPLLSRKITSSKNWSDKSSHSGHSRIEIKESVFPQLRAALVACLGSISLGFTLAFSSPAIPDLESKFALGTSETSWFGSLVTLGAAVGSLVAGIGVETFGRKPVLLWGNLPLVVGYIIMASVGHMSWMYTARAITGIGAGMMGVAVPLYITEITTSKWRGSLFLMNQIFISSGMLFAYGLGIPANYVWISIVAAGISSLMAVLMMFVPETPRWCIMKGKYLAATRGLFWLRGDQAYVDEEFKQIEVNLSDQPEKFSVSCLANKRYYKPFFLSISLYIFQKLSGTTAIEFYTESLFLDAGYEGSADIPPVIGSLVSIVGTFPSLYLVDKMGRKAILVLSGILLLISCSTIGCFYYLLAVKHVSHIGWLLIVCLVVFNFGFALGWGPVIVLVASEVLPIRIRGFTCGLALIISWSLAFVISKGFPVFVTATSHYLGFWIFAGFCFIGIIYVIIIVPETKGKTLEEIEYDFAHQK